MKHRLLGAILGGVLLIGPTTASSTLINDTVSIDGGFTTLNGLTVTDPGVEYTQSNGLLSETVDVFANSFSLILENLVGGSVGAGITYTLSGLDWFDAPLTGVISNVVLLSAATQNQVTVSNLTFNDGPGLDSGTISFTTTGGLQGIATSRWDFAITTTVIQVPEPGTLALFGLGLAGLGLARRRKRVA